MSEQANGNILVRRERDNNADTARRRSGSDTRARQRKSPPKDTNRKKSLPAAEPAAIAKHKPKIFAVLLALFATLLFLALISYTPYDEANASLSFGDILGLLQGDDAVRARADTMHNWLGLLGAVLANFCFTYTIGYAALVFPVLLMIWARHIFSATVSQELVRATTLTLVLGVLFASFAGTMEQISWFPDLSLEWSGGVGQFIATIFSQLIGSAGTMLLLTAGVVIALIIGLDVDLETLVNRVREQFETLRQKLLAKRKAAGSASAPSSETPDDAPPPAPPAARSEAALNDVTDEPARLLNLQAERKGAKTGWKKVLDKYDNEEPAAEQQGSAAPVTIKHPRNGQSKMPPAATKEKAPPAPREESASPAIPALAPEGPAKQTQAASIDEEHEPVSQAPGIPPEEPLPDAPALTLTVKEKEQEEKVRDRAFVDQHPLDEDIIYQPPTIDLLIEDDEQMDINEEELKQNAHILQEKLKTFKIEIENLTVTPGPVVTQYEFVPAAGVKVSQIESLANDISMALKARGIRIIAPVPGRGTVAVEIPNHKPSIVRFSSIIRSPKFKDATHRLPIALGKNISGDVQCADLAKMPHLLIAGSTGAGKSVGVNAIINSLLYKMHPRYLKMMIIDPKKIEMTQYKALERHFLAVCPDIDETIITVPQNAVIALKSLVLEMEQRYDILAKVGQRNIADYNQKVKEGKYKDTTDIVHRELPYIVCVIDELADLMMTASKDVEEPITRLAQLARAIGIHMIVATQRPSVDVITGLIKANFPARIAYLVASKIDSRTILDSSGAEHLLGSGDMLFLPGGAPKPVRIQNSFLSTEEVESICNHVERQIGYSRPYELPSVVDKKDDGGSGSGFASDRDELFDEAARIIVRHQQGSVSLLQRRLKVGYSRAARIVDQLEEAGIVGPFDGSKARQVLLESEMDLEAFL